MAQLEAHVLWEHGVGGSNPSTPTDDRIVCRHTMGWEDKLTLTILGVVWLGLGIRYLLRWWRRRENAGVVQEYKKDKSEEITTKHKIKKG